MTKITPIIFGWLLVLVAYLFGFSSLLLGPVYESAIANALTLAVAPAAMFAALLFFCASISKRKQIALSVIGIIFMIPLAIFQAFIFTLAHHF